MATDTSRRTAAQRSTRLAGAAEPRVWPNIAIPPGEFLAETLESLGLTQAELARRAERPPQAINEIVRGTKEITPDTALQFERVLGVPAHIWTRLEADYRYIKARLEDQERLKQEVPAAKCYPYAVIARHGWVKRTHHPLDQVRELLGFFGVASLHQVHAHATAFRRSAKVAASPEALAAWLRQGEREGQEIATSAFSADRLRETLPEIRALTPQRPETFQARLTRLLADSGVAVVVIPELPRTGAHGATRWLRPEKALVQLSVRYRWADIFWFSLFHELGHLLLHRRRVVFIEKNGDKSREEREADQFAMDRLIPPTAYADFVARGVHQSPSAVRAFAQQHGIAAGIVVGRLQHDRHVPHSHLNDLRSRFVWRNETTA